MMPYKRKKRRNPILLSAAFLISALLFIIILHCAVNTKESNPLEASATIVPPAFATNPTAPRLTVRPVAVAVPVLAASQESPPLYEIPLEAHLQKLLWSACKETGCPYELALSVIYTETRYQNLTGDGGSSIGYMQIQPRWHQARMERLSVTDLSDPLSNFRVGCDLLSELLEKYTVEEALTCYNTGSPGASPYASRVLAYMDETFPHL